MNRIGNSDQLFILILFILLVSSEMRAHGSMSVKNNQSNPWIKIDDFESPDSIENWTLADTDNNTNPRIENPQVTQIRSNNGSTNHHLIKKPAADGIVGNRKALSYLQLPVPVKVGETYTFYIRLNVEYFPNNHMFGISNLNPEGINEHNYNAFEPYLRVTDKVESDGTKNDGALIVCKGAGKGYAKIYNYEADREAKPFEEDRWYEIWYVVNNDMASNGGQTYDVYLRGGDEFPDQRQVFEDADFRIKRELPLIYFLANCNTGPADKPYGNGGLRYDDLYMAQGEVLTTPVE